MSAWRKRLTSDAVNAIYHLKVKKIYLYLSLELEMSYYFT